MFKSGKFVAKHIEPRDGEELDDEQIQPNGVDLTIGNIEKINRNPVIGDNDYYKGAREEVHSYLPEEAYHHEYDIIDSDNVYRLPAGYYVVIYGEKIEIPDKHIGIVFPRSRIMRCGGNLITALWDSGYEGIGEGGLWLSSDTTLSSDMRIAQMTFVRAENHKSYDGTHQGERTE